MVLSVYGTQRENGETNKGREDAERDDHLYVLEELASVHVEARAKHDWRQANIEENVFIELEEAVKQVTNSAEFEKPRQQHADHKDERGLVPVNKLVLRDRSSQYDVNLEHDEYGQRAPCDQF